MKQVFSDEKHGRVVFQDLRPNLHSAKCQPRDIVILEGPQGDKKLVERIVVDVRLGQGHNPVGVAKGMLW